MENEREYQRLKDEYEHIEQIRKLRSQHIMDWMRIGMPVGGALFAFFAFLGQNGCWSLTLLGWAIFNTPIITWRLVAHHIDKQIVSMYPRMLELDRQLNWVSNTTYYFNNLSDDARRYLENRLGVDEGWLNGRDYRQYVQQCRRPRRNPYRLLLDTWNNSQGRRSVGPRGHLEQDIAAGVLLFITLGIVITLVLT